MLNKNLLKGVTLSLRGLISTWHGVTRSFRIKIRDRDDFSQVLIEHPAKDTPQALQGMWQAYGQMRAARTLSRGAVLATGVAGAVLWLYQQRIQNKIRKLQKEIEETSQELAELTDVNKEKDDALSEIEKAVLQGTENIKHSMQTLVDAPTMLRSKQQELDDKKQKLNFRKQEMADGESLLLFSKKLRELRANNLEGKENENIKQFLDNALNNKDSPYHRIAVKAYYRREGEVKRETFDEFGVKLLNLAPEPPSPRFNSSFIMPG